MAIIKLTNQNANIITAGTFADARISSSSVSQHATSFDDNKIVNDLSTLGLRVHTQENLNASNTNSASFDVFQDSSGVANLTNVTRNTSGEYMSSVAVSAESGGTALDNGDITLSWSSADFTHTDTSMQFNSSSYNHTMEQTAGFLSGKFWWSFAVDDSTMQSFSPASESTNGQKAFFYGIMQDTGGISDRNNGLYNNNDSNAFYLVFDQANNDNSVYFFRQQALQATASNVDLVGTYLTFVRDDSGSGTLKVYVSTNKADYANGTLLHTFTGYSSTGNNKILLGRGRNNSTNIASGTKLAINSSFKKDISSLSALTASATGSFEGATITAGASTSSMGAVVTYQDNAGTNTLNTDIILKLSADNGSNYSTATLTALPDFATGIKMAKVNDLSVTAGTQLKYKIEFANQSSGSKEARIRGVSLQY